MAQLVVRNLEETVKRRLKARAAANDHSLEAEVRDILREAVKPRGRKKGFGTKFRSYFRGLGLELEPMPDLPSSPPDLE